MKKRTLTARLIGLWLVATLMLVGMPVVAQDAVMTAPTTAAAPAVTDVAPAAGETAAASSLLGPGELTLEQLALATLPAGDIPDALPAGKVAEKGHVNRLFEQEEGLSHILFQNRDGGKTAYFYGQPVKYIDADGHTRDKSKTLVPVNKTYGALGYDYGVEQNSIRHYYAKDPAVGILVELGGHTVRIIPQAGASLVLPRGQLNENRMVYNNLFGTNTALVYTPLLSGVKEDIVLRSFTGQSDFAFTYRTSGLSLINIDGTYAFVDESGLPLATLGDILITDAAGHTALGSLTVTETANGIYTVIVHADRAFLTAPTTVYPVTVDPTIHEKEMNHTTGNDEYAILDYGVYSGAVPSDSSSYHHLGYYTTSSKGRIIYKFPMFVKHSALEHYTYLNQYQISSVSMLLSGAPATGEPSTWVTAYPITRSWSNTAKAFTDATLFNSCTNGAPSQRSVIFFDDTYSEIILTDIFKAWAAFNNGDSSMPDPARGLALVDNTETNTGYQKKIYTVANSGADMVVIFDYTDVFGGVAYLGNVGAGGMLQRSGSAVTVGTYVSDATSTWLIEYVGNGYHVIRSSADQTKLLSSGPALNTVSGSSIPTASKWVLSVGVGVGGYIFKNASTNTVLYSANGTSLSLISAPGTTSSSYANTAWYTFEAEETVWPTSVSYTGETFFAPNTTTTFTPTVTPSNASYSDPQYFLWSVSSVAEFEFSDSNNPITACILSIPSSGGIATITGRHKFTGHTVSFTIKSGVLEEGVYWIQNVSNEKMIDGSATTSGTAVTQSAIKGDASQHWRLALQQDGTYTIRAKNTNLYLCTSGSNVVVSSTITDTNRQWRITKTNGIYRITSASATANALNGENDTLMHTSYNSGTCGWDFYNTTISIVNYYDESFDHVELIDDAIAFLNVVYNNYGISFRMKGNPIFDANAIASMCPNGDGPCTTDTCGDCSSHHKNMNNLYDYLDQKHRDNNEISVMWADRNVNILCQKQNNQHITFEAYGFSKVGYPSINIVCINGMVNEGIVMSMALTLAHEIAHAFGLEEPAGHNPISIHSCIMENEIPSGTDDNGVTTQDESISNAVRTFYQGILNSNIDPFCESCESALARLMPKKVFPGN